MEDQRTTGEKVADAVSKFGGSWTFIFFAMVFLALWIALQSLLHFDSYPYILLNLLLSCLAALQAPIIMMSQNRQSDKDRQRDEYDHEINVRTEQVVQELLPQIRSVCSGINDELNQLNHTMEKFSELFASLKKVS